MRIRHLLLIIALFVPLIALAEPADRILTAAHVVTMHGSLDTFSPGAVAINDGKIVAVGPAKVVLERFTAPVLEDFGHGLIMPGLINTHTHLPMIMMRGVADDMDLMTWLTDYIFPLEAKIVNAQFCYEATLVACAESLRRGVTTVVDMYYFEDDIARAVKESGMRGWLAETIVDFPAPDFRTPSETLAYTERCMNNWASDPLVKVIPGPHSLYTASPETLRASKALADKYQSLLTIHLSESAGEVAQVQEKLHKTPTAAAAELGLLGPRTLAAHCVILTPEDLRLLKQSGTAVAHNPDSNLKLACGIAPVAQMDSLRMRVGLGTDGPCSNNRLDLFDAMNLVAKGQKMRENNPAAMTAAQAVALATIGGARAIGAADQIGSLQRGKQADLIVVDLHGANYGPIYDLYSHLVYTCHGEMVRGTMVAGKWLMRDGRLLTLDEGRLRGIVSKYEPLARAAVKH